VALFDLPLSALKEYKPETYEAADFEQFWAGHLHAARSTDSILACDPVETGLVTVDTWDLIFAGDAGHPIRAWYTRPAGSKGAQLPAVVEFAGYGRGRGRTLERLTWASAGYAHLIMDTRGQGSQHGTGGDTADPVGSEPSHPGFLTRGILDRDDYYYRRLIIDAVRAVDAVRALADVDEAAVSVVGGSQGGGLALAVAGLVPEIRAVIANVPFLSHIPRALDITDSDPYGELVRYLSVQRGNEDQVFHTLSYIDAMHLARRAQAPALFSVGLRDVVCPPSTVFAAFNHYGALAAGGPEKEIAIYPWNNHEGGDAVQLEKGLHWLRRQLSS